MDVSEKQRGKMDSEQRVLPPLLPWVPRQRQTPRPPPILGGPAHWGSPAHALTFHFRLSLARPHQPEVGCRPETLAQLCLPGAWMLFCPCCSLNVKAPSHHQPGASVTWGPCILGCPDASRTVYEDQENC